RSPRCRGSRAGGRGPAGESRWRPSLGAQAPARIGEEHVFERDRRDREVADPVSASLEVLRGPAADALAGTRLELERSRFERPPVAAAEREDRLPVGARELAVRLDLRAFAGLERPLERGGRIFAED